jgi:hypothetical protein
VPKGHCAGSTSTLRARTPSGLAAGVSDRSDGCDNTGRRVPQGLCFWRLEAEGKTITGKAIKID